MTTILGFDVNDFRINSNEEIKNNGRVMITCPFHDHVDKHPSCSFNVYDGSFYCYVCCKGGDLTLFQSLIEFELNKTTYILKKKKIQEHNHSLYRLGVDDDYLLKRVKVETIKTFNIRVDDERVFIPLTNDGYVVRYKKIKKNVGKYFYINRKHNYFFSTKNLNFNEPLFIVEGIFGLLRLYEMNLQSVCIFGVNNIKYLPKMVYNFEIYTMLDNDKAGVKASYKAYKYRNIMPTIYSGDIDKLENKPTLVRNINEYKKHIINLHKKGQFK